MSLREYFCRALYIPYSDDKMDTNLFRRSFCFWGLSRLRGSSSTSPRQNYADRLLRNITCPFRKNDYLCCMNGLKVTIIGSGNVAEAFARALKESCNTVVQVYARNPERGRAVAALVGAEWCNTPSELKAAELYLICVSDRAVAQVAASLPFPSGAIVAHTAGCGTLEMLPSSSRRAIIYPFQTFSIGRVIDFRKVYLFIEAEDSDTFDQARAFAQTLSDCVADADSAVRAKIHLTGVLASNFVNNMYATAAQVLADVNLPFDVVAPVIAETAAKACQSGTPAMVQTGPAVRGDHSTMERHRQLIGQDELLRTIYDKISENIWRIKETLKR